MEIVKPDYKKIYEDILKLKHPDKIKDCKSLLSKSKLSAKDVVRINDIIFSKSDKMTLFLNQRHRSYDKSAILEILDYQKKYKLNNSQLANHFRLSRNSITKWKKIFLV
ncbi:hypothetical protein [Chryseobacterium populi]|uniref:Transposase n=1 Tax=Chryseobacterium populi TaxID=1144316 RepID=J2K5R2_9FLAO|nr:hypothetical protein [Chryseobacterium populi]EJL68543.1 hypothetical protein PMI13_03565 [Chryseobacterium populi]